MQFTSFTQMEKQYFGPVWFIQGENRGKYPFCHSLFIEGAGVLIDPASDREVLIRPREEKAFFEFGERALMKKHLERFMRSGRVLKKKDRYIKTG